MKKYILKPGTHQFAPGSPAVHCNNNLTDKEAEWYLQRYPHIAKLFTARPPERVVSEIKEEKTKMKRRKIKRAEVSAMPSGGEGGL